MRFLLLLRVATGADSQAGRQAPSRGQMDRPTSLASNKIASHLRPSSSTASSSSSPSSSSSDCRIAGTDCSSAGVNNVTRRPSSMHRQHVERYLYIYIYM
eukprot:GHVU01048116.1.p2 GENE.GHVU01048116.1~~GHVU01048116.1.p2  ORF type:complete len:100 (-),score=11.13 GHVU01048116.1:127-426(-)